MRLAYIIPLVFLLFVSLGFAQQTNYTTLTYKDAWIGNQNQTNNVNNIPFGEPCTTDGRVELNSTTNYGNCTTAVINWIDGGGGKHAQANFAFNITPVLSKIIYSFSNNYYGVTRQDGGVTMTGCTFGLTLYGSQNATWDEYGITGTIGNYPPGQTSVGSFTCSGAGIGTAATTSISTASGYDNIYTDEDGLYTLMVVGSGAVTPANVGTRENSQASQVSFILVDFLNVTIQSTDNPVVYFDFESRQAQNTSFAQADFVYSTDTNQLTPLGNVTAVFITSESDKTNTLANQPCQAATGYSVSTISGMGAGQPFTADADVVCFNLSKNHGNREFYGSIKVINATDNRGSSIKENDFFAAMYSPSYTTFSKILFYPDPLQTSRNATLTYQSSLAVTSNAKFRIRDIDTGVSTGFITYEGNSSVFTKNHGVFINGSDISISGSNIVYEFQVYGTDIDGTTHTSDFQNVTVIKFDPVLSDLTQGINILVQNEYGDGLFGTCRIDNFTQSIDTAIIGTNRVCTFIGFGLGYHNITITAADYKQKTIQINVVGEPYIQEVKMTPENTCLSVTYGSTPAKCEISTIEQINLLRTSTELNITSYYCQYSSTTCAQYINVNGTDVCDKYGLYQGFVCIDGFHPDGFPINSTVLAGQTPLNQSGNLNDAIGTPFSQLFGVTADAGLNFLAYVISIIIALGAALATRNGLITVVTMIGMIFTFSTIGWIPIWQIIIFGVISAFLVAKFISNSLAGGE